MASNSLPQRLGNELTPWDLGALEPYTPTFWPDFRPRAIPSAWPRPTRPPRPAWPRIIEGDVRRDIGGDEQRITTRRHRLWSDETFKHILLPVWMAAYKYNGKSYRFVVNGQTGEVQGERPWSIWKIGFAVLVVAAIALGAIYLQRPRSPGPARVPIG